MKKKIRKDYRNHTNKLMKDTIKENCTIKIEKKINRQKRNENREKRDHPIQKGNKQRHKRILHQTVQETQTTTAN